MSQKRACTGLSAGFQLRQDLAWIESPVRVQAGFNQTHEFQVPGAEGGLHFHKLLHADTVFTGKGAAQFHA